MTHDSRVHDSETRRRGRKSWHPSTLPFFFFRNTATFPSNSNHSSVLQLIFFTDDYAHTCIVHNMTTVPTELWPHKSEPPTLHEVLGRIGHLLDQLGYQKSVQALEKEAKRKDVQVDVKSLEGTKSLLDLWAIATSKGEGKGGAANTKTKLAKGQEVQADSDSSSSSDCSSSESDSSSAASPAEPTLKRKRPSPPADETESSSDSSESDSSSDGDSSSDETGPPAKKVKASKGTSDDDSDSDSSADSSSDEDSDSSDSQPAKAIVTKKSAAKSSLPSSSKSTSKPSTSNKTPPKKAKASKPSTSNKAPPKKAKTSKPLPPPSKPTTTNLPTPGASSTPSSVTLGAPSKQSSPDKFPTDQTMHPDRLARLPTDPTPTHTSKGPKEKAVPFSRIPAGQAVDPKFGSNQYVPYDYADRAYRDLSVTKGKGFTKEKNKKKRGMCYAVFSLSVAQYH